MPNPNESKSTSDVYHPKVFISYSHDSAEHMNRVLDLSDRLRSDGVDCRIDQYEMVPEGSWARWTAGEIEESDFVLAVCTETYLRRFKAKEGSGIGLGAKWEGAVITQELYELEGNNRKFVALLFSPADVVYIPKVLRTANYYEVYTEEGYENLYRQITNQPLIPKPEMGSLRPLQPRDRQQHFPAIAERVIPERTIPSDLERYLIAQRRIIEEHAKSFVGRTDVQRSFERFMANHRSGYFIVRGGPGQGKTAISSHLVKTYGGINHFISRTGGRSNARSILRSLVAQIIPLTGIEAAIPDGIPDLASTLQELSTIVAERQRRLISVIDGLDELAAEDYADLPSLFSDALPDGVYVIVTSRPGDSLNRLEEQLFDSPYEIFDLGPLEFAEMREILKAHRSTLSEAETERIAEASQGNPLYLRSVLEELERNPAFDLKDLPRSIEGFFRRATISIRDSKSKILHDLLGLLAVARKPLTISELSQITGERQREINEQGINPVRQFLLEVDDAYYFFHAGFHDFVTDELFYEDELRECHGMLAGWLQRPGSRSYGYRWSSLAYHLFASGRDRDLSKVIDSAFLAEKVRRQGYAVLEDVELLTRSMLEAGDPSLVGRCVEIVERLREVAGGDIIEDATRSLQSYRPGPSSFRTQLIAPGVDSVPGLDVYVGMLPKVDVAADFFEIVPQDRGLIIAIGDVPSIGIKSAFVARFIGNVFRKLIGEMNRPRIGSILGTLNSIISGNDYFKWVSMQCLEVDLRRGILTIASAGHPYPVLYSSRRRKCDQLQVRGDVLHSLMAPEGVVVSYEERHAEIGPGDILVVLTDGLTEALLLSGDPYGYRFTQIVEAMAGQSARAIGEAILDDWRAHPREADYADDVTLITIVLGREDEGSSGLV